MPSQSASGWTGVTLMIYGTDVAPMGPRSALAVWVMKSSGIDYQLVDATKDSDARAWAIKRSGTTLFPQIYINGEFIGSGEVIGELMASGFFNHIRSTSLLATRGTETR